MCTMMMSHAGCSINVWQAGPCLVPPSVARGGLDGRGRGEGQHRGALDELHECGLLGDGLVQRLEGDHGAHASLCHVSQITLARVTSRHGTPCAHGRGTRARGRPPRCKPRSTWGGNKEGHSLAAETPTVCPEKPRCTIDDLGKYDLGSKSVANPVAKHRNARARASLMFCYELARSELLLGPEPCFPPIVYPGGG